MRKINTTSATKLTRIVLAAVFSVTSCIAPFTASAVVRATTASELRSQSNQLQDLIDQNKANADNLSQQVDSLQQKIAEIDAEITATQNSINETEAKIASLKDQLAKTQADLDRQQAILKSNLKQLYKTTGASSVELLFSSGDFSSFVNKQEYLDQLKNGVKSSLESVMSLKKELEAKKAEQEKLQSELEAKKKVLEDSRSERSTLLVQTQGEEAKYRALVDDLKNQQREVNRQLAALATSISYYGNGSYPWADYVQDSGSDPWGMDYRECTSYAAWKVASTGRYMPTSWVAGRGNANRWASSARADGIAVDRNPRVGDVAAWAAGPLGHVMYVEDVYDNGYIHVSQYNWNYGAGPGLYSEMTIPATMNNMEFIHFE